LLAFRQYLDGILCYDSFREEQKALKPFQPGLFDGSIDG
jgi:hypothetical protein